MYLYCKISLLSSYWTEMIDLRQDFFQISFNFFSATCSSLFETDFQVILCSFEMRRTTSGSTTQAQLLQNMKFPRHEYFANSAHRPFTCMKFLQIFRQLRSFAFQRCFQIENWTIIKERRPLFMLIQACYTFLDSS